ncbi:hypothetical protein GCM10009690_10430 [Brevibacterium permense]|uniref:Uncharacterized protein n=1 Tax=Brevibacterium permense TaxID=234834 RepID=A0ABN2A246_9MICO
MNASQALIAAVGPEDPGRLACPNEGGAVRKAECCRTAEYFTAQPECSESLQSLYAK